MHLINSNVVYRAATPVSLFKFKHGLPFTLFLVRPHPNVAQLLITLDMCIPPRETTRQPPIIVNFDTEEFY
jgi:hypothetical protein